MIAAVHTHVTPRKERMAAELVARSHPMMLIDFLKAPPRAAAGRRTVRSGARATNRKGAR